MAAKIIHLEFKIQACLAKIYKKIGFKIQACLAKIIHLEFKINF